MQYSLFPPGGAVSLTHQPLVARADLVDAEGQAAGGHVAALPPQQPAFADLLSVVPGAAHGRTAVPVQLAARAWGGRGVRTRSAVGRDSGTLKIGAP